MINLTVKNSIGEVFDLTPSKRYTITKVEGLNPPRADVNITPLPNVGGKYNSTHLQPREIVLTVVIENQPNLDTNRKMLFKIFKYNEELELILTTDYEKYKIKCVVSQIEGSAYSKRQTYVVSVLCPSVYFETAQNIVNILSVIQPAFEFPFSIEAEGTEFGIIDLDAAVDIDNDGEVETGFLFKIDFNGACTNILLFNDEKEFFGINYKFKAGDCLTINTKRGQKQVVLKRGPELFNLINFVKAGSKWLQLSTVGNTLKVIADSGVENATIRIEHNDEFGGI